MNEADIDSAPPAFIRILFTLAFVSCLAEIAIGLACTDNYPDWATLIFADVLIGVLIATFFYLPLSSVKISGQYPSLKSIIYFSVISTCLFVGRHLNESHITNVSSVMLPVTEVSDHYSKTGTYYYLKAVYKTHTIKLDCSKRFYNTLKNSDSVSLRLNKGSLGFSFFEFDDVWMENKINSQKGEAIPVTFTETQLQVFKTLRSFPECQRANTFIDSITNHKRGLALRIIQAPNYQDNFCQIKAGYNQVYRFEDYFTFYVDTVNMKFFYYNTINDSLLTINRWRELRKNGKIAQQF